MALVTTVRGVWALFVAMAFLQLGNGLQGSLLSVRADIESFGGMTTGLVMSAFYLGFLVASIITPNLIAGVGHVRVFAALASIASTTVLLHSLLAVPYVWIFLRFVTGFSFAALYVVVESWLNQASTNDERGGVFSIYMMINLGGLAFGQYFLPLADPAGHVLFIVVSVLISLALVPVSLSRSPTPIVLESEKMTFRELYTLSPLGVVACALAGAGQGALLGMGAFFASQIGLDGTSLAFFMSLPLLAALLFQVPVGTVSDWMDRRIVIGAVAAAATAIALFVAFIPSENQTLFFALFAIFGGFVMITYGLVIAHANDFIPNEKMLPASAKLVLVYSIGSVAGPTVVGFMMSWSGPLAFFVFGGVVHLMMALFAVYRMTQRGRVAEEERGEYVVLAPRATPLATTAAIEAAAENWGDSDETEAEEVKEKTD